MSTLYLHIEETIIDDESVKQVLCRIGDEHLSKVYSYPSVNSDSEIKDSVSAKLIADGYIFDVVELE